MSQLPGVLPASASQGSFHAGSNRTWIQVGSGLGRVWAGVEGANEGADEGADEGVAGWGEVS